MNKFWEKVEHWNARLIPPAIVGLIFVIVVELVPYFKDFTHHYHTYILTLDYIILAIFAVDLTFLAIKAKSWKFFFKNYWLDFVAVVPLVIVFTVLSRIWRAVSAAGQLGIGQSILHSSLEVRKGVSVATRGGRIAKFVRLGARSIRVITKSRLFTKLTHHTDRHKPKNKKNLHKVLEKRHSKKKGRKN